MSQTSTKKIVFSMNIYNLFFKQTHTITLPQRHRHTQHHFHHFNKDSAIYYINQHKGEKIKRSQRGEKRVFNSFVNIIFVDEVSYNHILKLFTI